LGRRGEGGGESKKEGFRPQERKENLLSKLEKRRNPETQLLGASGWEGHITAWEKKRGRSVPREKEGRSCERFRGKGGERVCIDQGKREEMTSSFSRTKEGVEGDGFFMGKPSCLIKRAVKEGGVFVKGGEKKEFEADREDLTKKKGEKES